MGSSSYCVNQELSHEEQDGLKTICGTNEYMAPEMILRKGYGKAVDWWSMGALLYEMTAGYPPFQGKTPKDLNRKILNERVSLPKWLSPTAHQVSYLRRTSYIHFVSNVLDNKTKRPLKKLADFTREYQFTFALESCVDQVESQSRRCRSYGIGSSFVHLVVG